MDRQMRAALDRHITGNYGEDQFQPVCLYLGYAQHRQAFYLHDGDGEQVRDYEGEVEFFDSEPEACVFAEEVLNCYVGEPLSGQMDLF